MTVEGNAMALKEIVSDQTTVRPAPTVPVVVAPPPLENGDRLTWREFERRYEANPRLKKAELIEGVVHMPSPVRTDVHAEPHAHVIGWLVVYRAATPGVRLSDNGTLRLDDDNEVQPDGLLWIEGGRARLGKDG